MKKITDKMRMDFLSKQDAAYKVFGFGGHWEVRLDVHDEVPNFMGKTLRQAINAAIKKEKSR